MIAEISDYLRQFKNKNIMYFPNPGNGGDSVIASASYQCFERLDISYFLPNSKNFNPQNKIIFYGGGGNLIGSNTYSAKLIRQMHKSAMHLTILPQTIKNVDDLLNEFRSNVTIICREQVSYDYVRSRQGHFETLLMHDMAFSMDVERLLSDRSMLSAPVMIANFLLQRLMKSQSHTTFENVCRSLKPGPVAERLRTCASGGVLNAFRLDGEATKISIPKDNVDLSTVFMFGVSPPSMAYHSARSMFQTLMKFDEIRTNRLHVAISAALAGKKTLFYPNNYYKCRAVWEHSMKGRYPHVLWQGEQVALTA